MARTCVRTTDRKASSQIPLGSDLVCVACAWCVRGVFEAFDHLSSILFDAEDSHSRYVTTNSRAI